MPTPGESLLLLGARRLNQDWAKPVKADSANALNLLIEEMDLLSIQTELGIDVRAAVRIHGPYPPPAWDVGQLVNLPESNQVMQIIKTPINNPGTPFWKAYGQILTAKDS